MADKNNKGGLNPVVAGIAGAAIGAAATAGAVALSDEKNRKKVEKFVDKLKVEGEKAAKLLQEEAKKLQDRRTAHQEQPPKKLKGKTVKSKTSKKAK